MTGTGTNTVTLDPALVDRFGHDWSALAGTASRDLTIVALSGGADSVALLLLLHATIGPHCVAATVDHRLRPESGAEATGAAALCAGYGIAHTILRGAMPDRSDRSANVSARARDLRYALLADHAGTIGARWIATAHHADDQLETVIMRLNRGSGVSGLAGIRPVTDRIIRPLLHWRRAELAAIVAAHGIIPVDDPSNRDDRYDRARLRKLLDGADWLDPAMAARSAAALADAAAALDWAVARVVVEQCRFEEGAAWFTPLTAPAEIRRRVVARCIAHVAPGMASPRGGDLARLVAALDAGQAATLGTVQVRMQPDGWHFILAPPRRSL